MWSHLKVLPMTYGEFWNIHHYQQIMCTIHGVLSHYILFRCKISFSLDLRCFVAKSFCRDLRTIVGRKIWAKNCARGEKITNIRYGMVHFSPVALSLKGPWSNISSKANVTKSQKIQKVEKLLISPNIVLSWVGVCRIYNSPCCWKLYRGRDVFTARFHPVDPRLHCATFLCLGGET